MTEIAKRHGFRWFDEAQAVVMPWAVRDFKSLQPSRADRYYVLHGGGETFDSMILCTENMPQTRQRPASL